MKEKLWGQVFVKRAIRMGISGDGLSRVKETIEFYRESINSGEKTDHQARQDMSEFLRLEKGSVVPMRERDKWNNRIRRPNRSNGEIG